MKKNYKLQILSNEFLMNVKFETFLQHVQAALSGVITLTVQALQASVLTHLDQGRRPRRQRAVVRLKPVRKIPAITRDFVQNLVWVCSIYRNCLWRERPGSSAARISTHSFTNAVWPLIINIDWETLHKKQLRSATIHGTLATRSSIRRQHSQQITDEYDAFCLFLFQL